VQAAALTSLVRHTMRTASEFLASPAQLLDRVDRTLKQRPTLSVCTVLCLRLEHHRVTLAVGGHPLPLHISGQRITEIGAHRPLLGAFSDVTWRDIELELDAGSTLVAYTDGMTDAMDHEGGRFGLGRLRAALSDVGDRTAAEVIECLTGALADFQTGAHADDTAAIALHRLSQADGQKTRQQAETRGSRASFDPSIVA
jgi:phosphoserine phosphatase RsbU/P